MKDAKAATRSLFLACVGFLMTVTGLAAMLGWKAGLFLTGLLLFLIGTVSFAEHNKEE